MNVGEDGGGKGEAVSSAAHAVGDGTRTGYARRLPVSAVPKFCLVSRTVEPMLLRPASAAAARISGGAQGLLWRPHRLSYPARRSAILSTMSTTKSLHTERYLADRTTPLCSLEIAKSFAQLRCVLYMLMSSNIDVLAARRRRSMRITSARQAGRVPESFKGNGHRTRRRFTTSPSTCSARVASSPTWRP